MGDACPADALRPPAPPLPAAAGVCDLRGDLRRASSAACPADAKSTAVCRASAGVCDVAESCDGVSNDCPRDAFAPATTVCRPSAGTCDVAEICTGSSASCPADTGLPDTDGDTVCDAIDNCDAIANPSQANDDSDALGDACDPCTNIVPTVPSKTKLILTKLLAPATDDKLTFKGFFTSVPTRPIIDPIANGLRVLITDSTGQHAGRRDHPGWRLRRGVYPDRLEGERQRDRVDVQELRHRRAADQRHPRRCS